MFGLAAADSHIKGEQHTRLKRSAYFLPTNLHEKLKS
jgi:hypothetical protein